MESPLHTAISEVTILVAICWFGLKALVFFSFDWYFSMIQSEYTINEPANCISAATKVDQALCRTDRKTVFMMDRFDFFFFFVQHEQIVKCVQVRKKLS